MLKILDCTLRDGDSYYNWFFTKYFIKAISISSLTPKNYKMKKISI
jgi:hypothetical protein